LKLEAASTASHIKRAIKFWSNGDNHNILSSWVRDRYIKDKNLDSILPSSTRDSIIWKSILKYKSEIGRLMECNTKYTLIFTTLKQGSSLQQISSALVLSYLDIFIPLLKVFGIGNPLSSRCFCGDGDGVSFLHFVPLAYGRSLHTPPMCPLKP